MVRDHRTGQGRAGHSRAEQGVERPSASFRKEALYADAVIQVAFHMLRACSSHTDLPSSG